MKVTRAQFKLRWIGKPNPHEWRSNQWFYAEACRIVTDFYECAAICEAFEITHLGKEGSGRRAVWHKAGWESDRANKAQEPLVEIWIGDRQVRTKAEFFAIENAIDAGLEPPPPSPGVDSIVE
jgi:hypothetical protein